MTLQAGSPALRMAQWTEHARKRRALSEARSSCRRRSRRLRDAVGRCLGLFGCALQVAERDVSGFVGDEGSSPLSTRPSPSAGIRKTSPWTSHIPITATSATSPHLRVQSAVGCLPVSSFTSSHSSPRPGPPPRPLTRPHRVCARCPLPVPGSGLESPTTLPSPSPTQSTSALR